MKSFRAIVLLGFSITATLFIACEPDELKKGFKERPGIATDNSIYYTIDLRERQDDKFKVSGYLGTLTEGNKVYQFPAVVPGTYRISDFGRFVSDLSVYDQEGNRIITSQVSTNQWEISEPENAYYIEYKVAETWDTEVEENKVYRMGGTSIEEDHVLLNTFGVLGYPEGLKGREYFLKLEIPESWTVGTSLEIVEPNVYHARNYDYLADSPLLMGTLTSASITIDLSEIGVYSYSASGNFAATLIINELDQVMNDAHAFLIELPVDRYNYLFLFENSHAGALEHSYSSVYVLRDSELTSSYKQTIRSIAAHEFFHIVTPLNIRSELIADYNFASPVPSAHLWLYEGVTEWASDIMQYRSGSLDTEGIMNEIRIKYVGSLRHDPSVSLTQMSLTSYGAGGSEFANVYRKGALVAYLLDIKLLELSNGTRGLREVILELINQFGPDRPFTEDQFFDLLVEITYPEIESFIDNYIKGTTDLPMTEYLAKVGISFETGDETVLSLIEEPSSIQQSLFDVWSVNLDISQ